VHVYNINCWIKSALYEPQLSVRSFSFRTCILSLYHISVYIDSVSLAWPAVIQSQLPPRQFFHRSSGVVDFPYGDLSGVRSLLKEGGQELVFVMYYAPWCLHSIAARQQFSNAALYMNSEVSYKHEIKLKWNNGYFTQTPMTMFYFCFYSTSASRFVFKHVVNSECSFSSSISYYHNWKMWFWSISAVH